MTNFDVGMDCILIKHAFSMEIRKCNNCKQLIDVDDDDCQDCNMCEKKHHCNTNNCKVDKENNGIDVFKCNICKLDVDVDDIFICQFCKKTSCRVCVELRNICEERSVFNKNIVLSFVPRNRNREFSVCNGCYIDRFNIRGDYVGF